MDDYEDSSRSHSLREENSILEADNERLTGEVSSLRAELDRLRALAAGAGVASTALVIAGSAEAARVELEAVRSDLEQKAQAIHELRHPTAAPGVVESELDIVRANQRERAQLNDRARDMGMVLSRIAAALNIDRWDEDGGDLIVERATLAGQALAGDRGDAKLYDGNVPAMAEWARATHVRRLRAAGGGKVALRLPSPPFVVEPDGSMAILEGAAKQLVLKGQWLLIDKERKYVVAAEVG